MFIESLLLWKKKKDKHLLWTKSWKETNCSEGG